MATSTYWAFMWNHKFCGFEQNQKHTCRVYLFQLYGLHLESVFFVAWVIKIFTNMLLLLIKFNKATLIIINTSPPTSVAVHHKVCLSAPFELTLPCKCAIKKRLFDCHHLKGLALIPEINTSNPRYAEQAIHLSSWPPLKSTGTGTIDNYLCTLI